MSMGAWSLQNSATQCNTLQHSWLWKGSAHANVYMVTATHCNTLQHTATQLLRVSAHENGYMVTAAHCNTLQHTATHCNTLQHTATHCNTCDVGEFLHMGMSTSSLQHTATCCNKLQQAATQRLRVSAHANVYMVTATHHNTLQHAVTQSNTLPCTAMPCSFGTCACEHIQILKSRASLKWLAAESRN